MLLQVRDLCVAVAIMADGVAIMADGVAIMAEWRHSRGKEARFY